MLFSFVLLFSKREEKLVTFQALHCNCTGSSKKLNEQGWKKK